MKLPGCHPLLVVEEELNISTGDYVVSQQPAKSLSSHPLSMKIFRRGKVDNIHPYSLGFDPLANVIESDGPWDLTILRSVVWVVKQQRH